MKPFPLTWPADRPRTRHRETARTTVSLADARDHLLKQLDMVGVTHLVLSSNAVLLQNGLPASKQPKSISDPGVAVYFRLRGATMNYCVSCDQNDTISGNIRAVGLSIGELRATAGRLGIRLSTMLDLFAVKEVESSPTTEPVADTAYKSKAERPKQSPHPAGSWQRVLEIGKVVTWAEIQENYLRLCRAHAAKAQKIAQIEAAYKQAKTKFGYK